MRDLELALKAAADPTRTRILKLLERGALCVCQIQAVLGFAPSTVSKHLTILKSAELVEDARDGKWIEYRLAQAPSNPHARSVLAMVRDALERDHSVTLDRARLREVKNVPRDEVCAVYPTQGRIGAAPSPPGRAVTKSRKPKRGAKARARA
jgi:ArsR family transcriptional regulator